MAKHEFGIMERAPSPGERYDTYEPERYGCISVLDEDLEGLFADLRIMSTGILWTGRKRGWRIVVLR